MTTLDPSRATLEVIGHTNGAGVTDRGLGRVTLSDGRIVWIRELTVAEAWPFMNGSEVSLRELLAYSLCDSAGSPTVDFDGAESIPIHVAMQLLDPILKLNQLQGGLTGHLDDREQDFLAEGSSE